MNRAKPFNVQKMDAFGNREDHLKTLFVHDAVAHELQRPDIRAWPTSDEILASNRKYKR